MNKKNLRFQTKKKRDAISTYELLKLSNDVVKNFIELPVFSKTNIIACYISFGSEVFTHGFIRKYCRLKKVIVPVVNKETNTLTLSHLIDWNELDTGSFGILEPKEKFIRPVNACDVDIIIVPGIVFAIDGNRIGYGGGYYDKLLSKTKATKVAFAYDFQIIDELPFEPHDKRVDIIVTEQRVVNVSN